MKKFVVVLILSLVNSNLIGQSDECLQFDGINDYVFIGDVNDLGTSDFTIESWVYIENS